MAAQDYKQPIAEKIKRELSRPLLQVGKKFSGAHQRSVDQKYKAVGAAVRDQRHGRAPGAATALVYVHYGSEDLDPITRQTLDGFERLGVDLYFVANGSLSEAAKIDLAQRAVCVIERENIGYDFGGFRDGFLLGPRAQTGHLYDRCLFVNNTLQFLEVDPLPFLRRLIDDPRDLVGLIDSTDRGDMARYHIGSYLISCSAELTYSDEFRRFWEGLVPRSDKTRATIDGEFALYQYAHCCGFTAGGVLSKRALIQKAVEILAHQGADALADQILLPNSNFAKIGQRKKKLLGGRFRDVADLEALMRYEPSFHAGTIILCEHFDIPFSKRQYIQHPKFQRMLARKGLNAL